MRYCEPDAAFCMEMQAENETGLLFHSQKKKKTQDVRRLLEESVTFRATKCVSYYETNKTEQNN